MSSSYSDLLNVPAFGKKRESEFNPERGGIAYYCIETRQFVEPKKHLTDENDPESWEFILEFPDCPGRIAIGTREWLREFYEKKK